MTFGLRVKFPPDCAAAAALALFSAILSFYSYQAVRGVEQPDAETAPEVRLGARNFFIFQGANCAGSLSLLAAEKESLLEITGRSRTAVEQPDGIKEISLDYGAYFNPLGQLFRAFAAVRSPAGDFSASAERINPILLQVKFNTGNGIYERRFSLPGPVIARRTPDKRGVRLDYRPLAEVHARPLAAAMQTVSPIIGLRLSEDGPCEQTQPLDIRSLQALVPSLKDVQNRLLRHGR